MAAPLMMIDNRSVLIDGLAVTDLIIDKGLANDLDYWLAVC